MSDMLIEMFYEELDDKHNPIFFAGQPSERMKPDWSKGYWKINDLCDNMILNNKIDPDVMHLGRSGRGELEDIKKIRATLHGYLQSIEHCYENGRGSLVYIELLYRYRIWITGGQSWGDAPTDLYYPVEMMNRLLILDKVGFNPKIPDYKKMFNVIVKEKTLQPLLIGLDPDIDKVLEKEFKNSQKG